MRQILYGKAGIADIFNTAACVIALFCDKNSQYCRTFSFKFGHDFRNGIFSDEVDSRPASDVRVQGQIQVPAFHDPCYRRVSFRDVLRRDGASGYHYRHRPREGRFGVRFFFTSDQVELPLPSHQTASVESDAAAVFVLVYHGDGDLPCHAYCHAKGFGWITLLS